VRLFKVRWAVISRQTKPRLTGSPSGALRIQFLVEESGLGCKLQKKILLVECLEFLFHCDIG
jgi:hypothetical protein